MDVEDDFVEILRDRVIRNFGSPSGTEDIMGDFGELRDVDIAVEFWLVGLRMKGLICSSSASLSLATSTISGAAKELREGWRKCDRLRPRRRLGERSGE